MLYHICVSTAAHTYFVMNTVLGGLTFFIYGVRHAHTQRTAFSTAHRGAEPLWPLLPSQRGRQRTHLHLQQAGGDGHAADAVGGGFDVHSPVQVDQARQRDCGGDSLAQRSHRPCLPSLCSVTGSGAEGCPCATHPSRTVSL